MKNKGCLIATLKIDGGQTVAHCSRFVKVSDNCHSEMADIVTRLLKMLKITNCWANKGGAAEWVKTLVLEKSLK